MWIEIWGKIINNNIPTPEELDEIISTWQETLEALQDTENEETKLLKAPILKFLNITEFSVLPDAAALINRLIEIYQQKLKAAIATYYAALQSDDSPDLQECLLYQNSLAALRNYIPQDIEPSENNKKIRLRHYREGKITVDTTNQLKPSETSMHVLKGGCIGASCKDIRLPENYNDRVSAGKWVITLPKGTKEVDTTWEKVLSGVKKGIFLEAKIYGLSEDYPTQAICVYTPFIENKQEIRNAYQYLTAVLGIHPTTIVGYKPNLSTINEIDTYLYTAKEMDELIEQEDYNKFFKKLEFTGSRSLELELVRIETKYPGLEDPRKKILKDLTLEVKEKVASLKETYKKSILDSIQSNQALPFMQTQYLSLTRSRLKAIAKKELADVVQKKLVHNPDAGPHRSQLEKVGRVIANLILLIPTGIYWLATGNPIINVSANKTQGVGEKVVDNILRMKSCL